MTICMKSRSLFSEKSKKKKKKKEEEKYYKILSAKCFTQLETNILELLYNKVRYGTVVDIRQFADGAQNMRICLDHIESKG